ncbi:MAG: PHP domain-containing protein [Methanomassiliicoccales archaeon]|nr:PHP domain-containing protein [Methanomassiliicoccales archaeon]
MDLGKQMRFPRINLHNHTIFSDGDFTVEEVVRSARDSGLTHVAITDHFETEKLPSPLRKENFDRYLDCIRSAGDSVGNGMKVLAGVEIDANPERCDLYELPFDMLNRLDLVLFEFVDDPLNGGVPLNELRSLVKELRVPFGFCHWDMDRIYRDREPEWLADKLAEIGAFVEVPTSQHYARQGRFLYEHSERFYRAFDGKVKVSIGTDMHHSLDQVGNIDRGLRFLRDNRLCDQLLFNEK